MDKNLTKKTLFLRKGDWDYIAQLYGDSVPTSKIIRTIVSNFVDNLKKNERANDQPVDMKVDL